MVQSAPVIGQALSIGQAQSAGVASQALSLGQAQSSQSGSVVSFTGGIHGRQFTSRKIPADRFVLADISIDEVGTAAVDTDELIDLNVTPAKLDRTYMTPISSFAFEPEFFRDISGVGPVSNVEVNDEDAANFPDATITGIRVAFEVPDNFTSGNVDVYLRLSPSTTAVGNYGIDVSYRVNGGSLTNPAGLSVVTPSGTANVQTLVGPILTLAHGTVSGGDSLVLRIERYGADVFDTRSDNMRLFSVVMRYAV